MPASRAGPSSPEEPSDPVPATDLTVPVVSRFQIQPSSAMNRFPPASKAMSLGCTNGPPVLGLATVDIPPSAPIRRRVPSQSPLRKIVPALSTAIPAIANVAASAGPPSPVMPRSPVPAMVAISPLLRAVPGRHAVGGSATASGPVLGGDGMSDLVPMTSAPPATASARIVARMRINGMRNCGVARVGRRMTVM